ncbi:MAG TPA: GNAT family N-acetyltransferase [Lacisediminihabitans sp.]|uniref:GNAT family N-acetyltransferase n=1 Tax=Lacisediminihabitans sp. TaxID=2787631 RepID=UPI002EDACA9F
MADIRRYRQGDRADIREICIRTGRSGEDATGWLDDDDLLPEIYALPYVDLEPETAFVVDVDGRARGYILGVPDTRSFVERLRAQWLPGFAAKHPLTGEDTPTQRFVREGRDPERLLIPELDEYPAHLHIDLLPELQGQGLGRRLVRALLAELRSRGVPGVWLEYGPDNQNAAGFYRRLGFAPLPSGTSGTRVGLHTDARV